MEKHARRVKHLCLDTEDMPDESIAHFVRYLRSRSENLFPNIESLEIFHVAESDTGTMREAVKIADNNAALFRCLVPPSLCSLTLLDDGLETMRVSTPEALGCLKAVRRLKFASGDCDKQGEFISSSGLAASLEEFTSVADLEWPVSPLVDALSSSCFPSSLVHLSLNNNRSLTSRGDPQEPTVAMYDIRKLFIFTNMTRLYIHTESKYVFPTNFGDDELAEMVPPGHISRNCEYEQTPNGVLSSLLKD
jgi:hypothetical protein